MQSAIFSKKDKINESYYESFSLPMNQQHKIHIIRYNAGIQPFFLSCYIFWKFISYPATIIIEGEKNLINVWQVKSRYTSYMVAQFYSACQRRSLSRRLVFFGVKWHLY